MPRCRRVKRTNYAEGYPGRHFLNFDTCDKLGAQVFTTIAGNLLRFSARLFSPGNEVNVGEQVCQRSVVYDAFRFTRMSSTPFIAVLEKKKKKKENVTPLNPCTRVPHSLANRLVQLFSVHVRIEREGMRSPLGILLYFFRFFI